MITVKEAQEEYEKRFQREFGAAAQMLELKIDEEIKKSYGKSQKISVVLEDRWPLAVLDHVINKCKQAGWRVEYIDGAGTNRFGTLWLSEMEKGVVNNETHDGGSRCYERP